MYFSKEQCLSDIFRNVHIIWQCQDYYQLEDYLIYSAYTNNSDNVFYPFSTPHPLLSFTFTLLCSKVGLRRLRFSGYNRFITLKIFSNLYLNLTPDLAPKIFFWVFLGDPPLVESPLGPGLFVSCVFPVCL